MSELSQITLVVTNTEQLAAGGSAVMNFDQQGGSIGADASQNWVLRDRNGGVAGQHCLLHLLDNQFCITDTSGATFINGSSMPIGLGRHARLNENDVLGIGPYRIRVSFEQQTGMSLVSSQRNLETLIGADQEMVWEIDEAEIEEEEEIDTPVIDDPLSALDELSATQETLEDYLSERVSEDDEEQRRYLGAEDQIWIGQNLMVQADNERNQDSAIELKHYAPAAESVAATETKPTYRSIEHPLDLLRKRPLEERSQMNSSELDQLEQQIERDLSKQQPSFSTQASAGSTHATAPTDAPESTSAGAEAPHEEFNFDSHNHMVAGPMLKGLGAKAGDPNDMAEMQNLSEEMGESLKAAIQGLLELHQQVSESRYGLMNKNLQPIEDNPLRLGLSYDETIQTMFDSKRSIVHLSAPAAIEESLKTVKNHNEAVLAATTEALSQILRAFSPEVLLKRFHHYRRAGTVTDESDSWAWQMYQSYYRELTSNRQHGFEKLFWEIFDQSYDRELRTKQQEF